MAGYSDTPLEKKLGITADCKLWLINHPHHYFSLFTDFPPTAQVDTFGNHAFYNIIHFFVSEKKVLQAKLPILRDKIAENGTIWVSWPKGKSKLPKDLNEDDVRNGFLSLDMVDVKVCAIDNDWSGLKGVIRLEKRKNS